MDSRSEQDDGAHQFCTADKCRQLSESGAAAVILNAVNIDHTAV